MFLLWVLDVQAFQRIEEKLLLDMFVPAHLWNAPLSGILSWNTLHNFTPFSMHAQARPEKGRLFSCLHDFGGIPQGLPTRYYEQSNFDTLSQVCFAIWALHQYEHSYWNHGAPQLNSESWSFRWCTVYFPKDLWDWLIYLSTFIVNINQM